MERDEFVPEVAASAAATDWRRQMERAPSVRQVIEQCQAFVSRWNADQLAELPQECYPPVLMSEPEDISIYAFNLMQAQNRMGYTTAPELRTMATFFAAAAIRLSQLLAKGRGVRGRP